MMTLEDFGFIARWLAAYPGKKNVFWLSSGFPIEAKPLGSASYRELLHLGSGISMTLAVQSVQSG
jgi:hypothetical protein